ncbi:MAG: ATP synthase F1 subunit gamma [Oscillospiraceae bacterium]|jgi:F-type H+-transporting ATPase subunit gamma|nr:ATP synthase F1 subunit gamma [Oscillospiraceae bacterium]
MSSVSEIRRRIQAVEQTKKITGAMEMVSSGRMRRVMSHIEYNRRYFRYIRNAMLEIIDTVNDPDSVNHPYFTERENPTVTYVVISGDKGLCGSYNAQIITAAENALREHPTAHLITLGNVAEDYFVRRGRTPDIAMYGIVQDPTMKSARSVARDLMRLFDEGLTDEINIIYTSFYGETKGYPVTTRLLPIVVGDYNDADIGHYGSEIEYMPDRRAVFDRIVPQYIIGLLFGLMVQAYAGEHYARMNAMHSSTQNAGDMLKALKSQYNLARQSAITNEIAEISGAALAIDGK